MFCDWISYPKDNLYFYKNSVGLIIRDNCLNLNKEYWGIIENKIYHPILLKIDDLNLLKYFIIGLIDADGYIKFKVNKKYVIELVGNKIIMNWVKEMFKNIGYNGSFYEVSNPNKVWSRLKVHKKNDVIKLAKILNINNCDFCMDRKWKDIKYFMKEAL